MAKINNPLIVLEKGKDEQTKTVDLAMADGNQTITPDSGKTLSSVTVTKPATMLPANIKKDVNIGGVVGTLEEGIDISDTTATAADVRAGKDFYIADGTKTQGTIIDYDGAFTGAGSYSNLNIHYGDTAPTDTSKLWIKAEEPNNISFPAFWTAEQIVEGISDIGTELPNGMYNLSVATVGTKIYLLFGYNTTNIRVFDTETNTLETLSTTLSYEAEGVGAAAVGTKIYLFGGYQRTGYIQDIIQVFDTETNTLETLSTTLPYRMYGMGTAAVGTKIYLFGGYKADSPAGAISTIQVFDTTNNSIQTLSTSLPLSKYNGGTAAVGTKIYLFGGFYNSTEGLKAIQVFDTTNNSIQTLSATLFTGLYNIGAAAVGTKIYLFGGENGAWGRYKAIQVFDTTNNSIQTLSASLPLLLSRIGVAAVGINVYLFGGYNGGNGIATIYKFTIDIPLTTDDIVVEQGTMRTFKVLKSPTEVEVTVKNVYKGDSNLAKFVDAYLYDGTNWVNVNTGETA